MYTTTKTSSNEKYQNYINAFFYNSDADLFEL